MENKDPGYTVPAEFVSKYYHKRVCFAAVGGDEVIHQGRLRVPVLHCPGKEFDEVPCMPLKKGLTVSFTPERKDYSPVAHLTWMVPIPSLVK